jgi:protease-4
MLPMSRSSAGGDTIAAALRAAGADADVTAVVLRVDSPGGSVTASETIWREVCRLRDKGKPVVASMGSVAASGGYYVSMAADVIVANPGTVTGSIGVVTGKLVARDLKERLGVGSDVVRTNTNADAWSVNAPFSAEQHAIVEAEADLFYDDFIRRVAEARSMTVDEVDAIARGRIWTGADAHERGLVDELGGHRDAVRRAKLLAGLDADTDVRLVAYPASSVRDVFRPKASSQPAALVAAAAQPASLVDLAALLIGGRTAALWAGEWRF